MNKDETQKDLTTLELYLLSIEREKREHPMVVFNPHYHPPFYAADPFACEENVDKADRIKKDS